MAAILVSQNNETAAMLVSQTSPLGVELLSYANAFFCSNKKTREGVHAGCVGVRKNYRYVRNNTLEDELHTRIPFATQNQTYINITTIYVRSMG